jgi:NaMN:DMB phosphoribosyltransferase
MRVASIAAAALMHKLTAIPVADCVGAGTRLSPQDVLRKQQVIEAAVSRHAGVTEALDVRATFGGFEIWAASSSCTLAAIQVTARAQCSRWPRSSFTSACWPRSATAPGPER